MSVQGGDQASGQVDVAAGVGLRAFLGAVKIEGPVEVHAAADEEVRSLRVIVRPISRDMIASLANDIVNACKYLEQHGRTATPSGRGQIST